MKQVFPTIYSTLSHVALADFIARHYDLPGVECSFFLRGVGDTYMVNQQENRFVFRVYRNTHRSLAEIEAEVQLLLALKQGGVPVAYPISDLQGNVIHPLQAAEGVRHAVLFSYAPGKPAGIMNEVQLSNLGKAMAGFHNISASLRLSPAVRKFDLDTTLFKPLEILREAFAEDAEGYAWMWQAAKTAQQKLEGLNTAAFSAGYCQFDFLPKNFHFDEDGNVTFFDFDFMGYGWLVNDIMTFWQHFCLDMHFGKMQQEEANKQFAIFLEAYRMVRSVSADELEAIPYLSLGFWLFYMCFHTTHDQFYPFVQPAHLKLRTDLVRKLMERYWN